MNPLSFSTWQSWAAPLGALGAFLLTWVLAELFLEKAPLPFSFQGQISPSGKKGNKAIPLAVGGYFSLSILVFAWDPGFGLLLIFLGLLATGALRLGPRWWEKRKRGQRQAKMSEIFPQALGMSVQALKAGQTLPQVVEYLSRECPPPLREEFGQVGREIDLGASAEQALLRMAERCPQFEDFHQFVESYRVSRHTGANLTHLLEVLLEGMEEKNRILRKMGAMTAQARLSGLIMGLLPFALAAVFFVMDPTLLTPLVTEPMGWGILGAALFLETIGFLVIRQMLQLEV